jgi:hypothetical protein
VSASDVLRGRSGLNSKNLISLLFCHFAPARRAAAVCRCGITRRLFTPAGLPPGLGTSERSMSENIVFHDADGKRVSGRFDVSDGMITVTARDGRTKTSVIEEGMLSPETLAKMLLLQLHQEGRPAD